MEANDNWRQHSVNKYFMTLQSLHKQLGELVVAGHGLKPVCIDKITFTHPLESDGCTILDIKKVEIKFHNMLDDDGGTKTNKKGQEVYRTSVVILGNNTH